MVVYAVYLINRAGGLIYHYDHVDFKVEVDRTFSYPLEMKLKLFDEKVTVDFGQRDGVKVGHVVLGINDQVAVGRKLQDGRDIFEFLANEENYPLAIKFGRPALSTNEKLTLASMFHSLYAIASQLSPVPHCSGIQVMETDTFKLHCMQTMTGVKFIVITDISVGSQDVFLKKLHELYADYALKNPFYSIDMPIRAACEKFDLFLKQAIEKDEKYGNLPG